MIGEKDDDGKTVNEIKFLSRRITLGPRGIGGGLTPSTDKSFLKNGTCLGPLGLTPLSGQTMG